MGACVAGSVGLVGGALGGRRAGVVHTAVITSCFCHMRRDVLEEISRKSQNGIFSLRNGVFLMGRRKKVTRTSRNEIEAFQTK